MIKEKYLLEIYGNWLMAKLLKMDLNSPFRDLEMHGEIWIRTQLLDYPIPTRLMGLLWWWCYFIGYLFRFIFFLNMYQFTLKDPVKAWDSYPTKQGQFLCLSTNNKIPVILFFSWVYASSNRWKIEQIKLLC